MPRLILPLIFAVCILPAMAQTGKDSSLVDLKQYTGFYNVGTKPNKSRFMARIYLDQDVLMFCAPGGSDSPFQDYVGNHRFEGKDNYAVQFEVNSGRVKGFILYRPREVWSTDLYGTRNEKLDQYNDSESLSLNNSYETKHFNLLCTDQDSANIRTMADNLELNYSRIVSKFQVMEMPMVHVKVYPTFESYHLAVLTPNAPKWQKGMAWSEEDIRMVSPEAVEVDEKQFVLTGAAVHEFAHCVQMQIANKVISPRWLCYGKELPCMLAVASFISPMNSSILRMGSVHH